MTAQAVRPREDRATLGIGLMLAAWVFFGCVDTSVKWLVLAGIPALQVAFMRYAVHLVVVVATSGRQTLHGVRATRGQVGLLLLRGALLLSSTVSNFIALNYLPLTVTAAVMFSSPILVSLLSVPLLGERVGPWRWFAILAGFAGVLIVIRPFGAEFHVATLLSLYNAVALALFSIITRRLSGEIAPATMQLYMGLIGSAVLLVPAALTWTSPESLRDWALLLMVGALAWAGHEVFSRAHVFADASLLMPFSYSYIVYMAAGGYLVFGDVPDAMTLLGAVVVVASGLLIWWRENRTPRPAG